MSETATKPRAPELEGQDPGNRVSVPVFCLMTGYAAKQVEQNMACGLWPNGIVWGTSAAGTAFIIRSGFRRWVRGEVVSEPGWRERRRALSMTTAGLRRALAVERQTPAWADRAAIRQIYEEARALSAATGIQYHVDHFYPLQGQLVSGLHVAQNLRIIEATDNIAKGNRYQP